MWNDATENEKLYSACRMWPVVIICFKSDHPRVEHKLPYTKVGLGKNPVSKSHLANVSYSVATDLRSLVANLLTKSLPWVLSPISLFGNQEYQYPWKEALKWNETFFHAHNQFSEVLFCLAWTQPSAASRYTGAMQLCMHRELCTRQATGCMCRCSIWMGSRPKGQLLKLRMIVNAVGRNQYMWLLGAGTVLTQAQPVASQYYKETAHWRSNSHYVSFFSCFSNVCHNFIL